jgi:hypothetical protein
VPEEQKIMSTTPPETPQPHEPPQGALSGALSSLVAVGQYASRACAAVGSDFTTLFAHNASPAQRIKAASGLVLTAVIVAVLGYAALQEWRIHIAYNPELAHQQLLKAEADAIIAKQQADAARAVFSLDPKTICDAQLAKKLITADQMPHCLEKMR